MAVTVFGLNFENRTEDNEQEREQEKEQEKNTPVLKILDALNDRTLTANELMGQIKLNGRRNFLYTYLYPAIKAGYVAMLYPDNPKHRNQQYYLTQKGKEIKEKLI